jgi:uncharacterized protein (TIGR03382 family)
VAPRLLFAAVMMRWICVATILGVSGVAHADATNSCTGMISGTLGLVVPDAAGTLHPLTPADANDLFGQAECECDTKDIELELNLTTPFPASTAGTVEVWVGSGCDDLTTRTQSCEKIASPALQDLTINAVGVFRVPVPSRALFSPLTHSCDVGAWMHQVYLVVYADPAAPLATCTLDLAGNGALPAAPTGASAARQSNGDVIVTWAAQSADPNGLDHYDVVCADLSGGWTLRAGEPHFSACIDGAIVRRSFLSTDGTPVDPATPAPQAQALTPLAPYATCGQADSGATSLKIEMLNGGDPYQAVVVHSDAFGNGAASSPFPIGLVPKGGCDFGGGPAPTAASLLVVALVLLLRRRRAA